MPPASRPSSNRVKKTSPSSERKARTSRVRSQPLPEFMPSPETIEVAKVNRVNDRAEFLSVMKFPKDRVVMLRVPGTLRINEFILLCNVIHESIQAKLRVVVFDDFLQRILLRSETGLYMWDATQDDSFSIH